MQKKKTNSGSRKSQRPPDRSTDRPPDKKRPFAPAKGKPRPQVQNKPVTAKEPEEDMRLNKFIAHAGICSRRKAGELIAAGLVTVNGEVAGEMGYRVQPGDVVTYKGKVVKPVTNLVYLLMNKPKNTITTSSDDKGRKTVLDIIGTKINTRVYPVGRLDRDTTGLLLLTNDGELALKLSHPSGKVAKVYHVTLDKNVAPDHLDQISQGFELDDGPVVVDAVGYVKQGKKNEVGIEIHMGKNRIVRRIFEHFGYVVEKLDRVYYAGLTKKDLPRGRFRPLTRQEVIMLKHFM